MNVTQMEITVRCTEIDVNGHVNNAKYLEYYEWGREEWFERQGLDYQTLKDLGAVTVVARAEVDYHQAAHQNDRLIVTTWLERVGRTSLRMRQRITGSFGVLVGEALFVIVTVSPETGRPVPVPEPLRALAAASGT
ncbi:acyl-CoA thioesterase [Alicyclobacillus vulcanalis]|uniref:Acyl-CoA thioester hydrolase/thioesterase-3 n=1 Tax=Alicyclobacillus vulcanalis TaxID=252246 RepID=A0A1N7MYM1_9BACL|nr:thioesterase family protein [Alicyclobacillus vulcanalis]SIS91172.1 acyl-CoA thioester hydrolase/thioesterase-3 [Alicyclobacillus vulcanalis]